MNIFNITLVSSILLCTMIAGFLFAYSVVVMPGIRHLGDKDFLSAFKVTDQIIQNNDPLFIFVWVGSVLSLIATAITGYYETEGMDSWLLMLATITYLAGVQLTTIFIHLPLNNVLQTLNLETINPVELNKVRSRFEPRWNTFNNLRTINAAVASLLLIIIALGQ